MPDLARLAGAGRGGNRLGRAPPTTDSGARLYARIGPRPRPLRIQAHSVDSESLGPIVPRVWLRSAWRRPCATPEGMSKTTGRARPGLALEGARRPAGLSPRSTAAHRACRPLPWLPVLVTYSLQVGPRPWSGGRRYDKMDLQPVPGLAWGQVGVGVEQRAVADGLKKNSYTAVTTCDLDALKRPRRPGLSTKRAVAR